VTTGIRITSRGCAPFNAGCPSNHRYLWIDVPYTDALGYSIPPHVCPSARRLQCKNPNLVQKYNTQLSHPLTTKNLDTDLDKISNTALQEGWSHHLEQEYNQINDRQYTIRKDIESKIETSEPAQYLGLPNSSVSETIFKYGQCFSKNAKEDISATASSVNCCLGPT
jgi:hypothetical protein